MQRVVRAPDDEREVLLVHVAAAADGDERVREAAEQLAGGVGGGRCGREHGHLALAEVQHHVLHATHTHPYTSQRPVPLSHAPEAGQLSCTGGGRGGRGRGRGVRVPVSGGWPARARR